MRRNVQRTADIAFFDSKLISQIQYTRSNNFSHQYGDMHIAASVSFVQIYGKIMKSA